MIADGGLLYSQIENQLPNFVQQNHTKFSQFIEKYYEFLELNLLTFTDLELDEDSVIQESANSTYTVTVDTGNNVYSNSANKFFIDDAVSPDLTLTTGTYAIFDQGDQTNDGHYLRISKSPNGIHTAEGEEYTTDDRDDVLVTYEGTPADLDNITLETGTEAGGILLYEDEVEVGLEVAPRVIFYVSPDLAGESLYYYCNNHSGMGGQANTPTQDANQFTANGLTITAAPATATAGAIVSVTGTSLTSSLGEESQETSYLLPGVSSTTSSGTVTITASSTLTLTGVSATSTTGTLQGTFWNQVDDSNSDISWTEVHKAA